MWKLTLLLVLTLDIISQQKINAEAPPPIGEGHCIWYGTCDVNPEKMDVQYLNCKYDGPAKDLTDEDAISKLTNSCPELAAEITDENGKISTCCSPENINILSQQLTQLDGILYRCPVCISNLRKSFCYFACHPRHSAFLMPTLYKTNNETGVVSVWAVTEYINPAYTENTYDSCDKVYYPELNTEALTLLCGPWGADNCSPERLFNYFGNNQFAPFNITYYYSDSNTTGVYENGTSCIMDPFNVEVIPCNTNDSSMHCLCSDCAASCPAPPEPIPPPDYIVVFGVRLYAFLLCLLYAAFFFFIFYVSCFTITGLPGNTTADSGCCTCNQKMTASIERTLERSFQAFAKGVASFPIIVLVIGAIVIVAFSFGVKKLQMTTDPVELWAAPDSRSRLEKNYYDQSFGPFYRTNQVIITTVGVDGFNLIVDDINTGIPFNYSFGPVFDADFMFAALDLQLEIMSLVAEYDGKNVTLSDVCIMPLAPQQNVCMIQSVMNYWQNDPDKLLAMMTPEDPYYYAEYFLKCASNPTYVGSGSEDCMASYGGPILPYVALGGFLQEGQSLADNPKYEESTALVMTFLGQNYLDKHLLGPSLAWEKVFLDFMKSYTNNSMMDIAYNAERGIEDEIIRESKSDVSTIFISYFVMFAYVTISLGNFSCQCSRLCIETKMLLGFSSVSLVLLSVVSSIGFCGYCGVGGTLFVLEVIPFLVLAVGVDNIFLLVQSWQRTAKFEDESIEDHVARIVGKIGPSMLLATTSEAVCFFLGALSKMPAVHAFSVFAGVALTFDFILQMTCLVALITLDAKRYNSNRCEVFCCFKGPKSNKQEPNTDICFQLFEKVYAPLLLNNVMRTLVLWVFAGVFTMSCIFVPHLNVGLEQDIGMPDDSFVLKYFNFLGEYLSVGPPVYFVLNDGYNFPIVEEQNFICSSSGCNDDSALTQIFVSSLSPDVSYIATGASSWLDSYFSWISDTGAGSYPLACCRLDANGDFIDSAAQWDTDATNTCLGPDDFVPGLQRPLPEYFMDYLPDFLKDNPHQNYCPQAGHPAYGTAVNILNGTNETTYVGANYYMAYHKILKTSADFTYALDRAYALTDRLTSYIQENSMSPQAEFFPYSIFYVYYEQYLSMWATTISSLAISLSAVFIVMFLLTGFDFRSTIINLIIIFMIVMDLMAFMYFWNIQLNAISLVNLVMATGISVEFCSHVTRAFSMTPSGTKVERATTALAYTGSSVLSGITLTKFGGIIILAFANSQVIKIFYFRMYMLIVILGATHGLIFLPVLLSLIGPPINPYNKNAAKNVSNGKSNDGFETKETEYF